MSRAPRLLALAAGLALFAYFINHVGLEELAGYARRTGWMLLPIFVLWIPIYACSAAAWRLILAHEPDCPGFGRLFAAIVSGSAINYITPFFAVGGEPFKATVAAEWLQSRRRAAASVVIQRLLFTLAHLLSMILALMLGVLLLPHNPRTLLMLIGFSLAVGILAFLVFMVHRRGLMERCLDLAHRLPGLRRLARSVEPRREALIEMDTQITDFYHRTPVRFWWAFVFEFLGRGLTMAEFLLIPISVGVRVTYPEAYLIGGFASLVGVMLFVFPFEMGTKEGGLYTIFKLLGLDPSLGIYSAVICRVRELAWIAVGLILIALIPGGRPALRTVETQG
ncbi:MAG TPA: lysylphosphatidylglycerol synthase transmembrane domain-containing protein [Gemmatimonadales bacterium]|jgi:uncharacterized protein (TIRG00374 family)|nr:lysylphosphatidylglycerol synthase transmembrane domain-containing protein [Gemmatimonadales bacterium]